RCLLRLLTLRVLAGEVRNAFVNEHGLENADADGRHGLVPGGERVEISGLERAGLPRIAMGVGNQTQDRSGVRPCITLTRLGHRQQFTERHTVGWAGVDAEDAGALPDEVPCTSGRLFSASSASRSRSPLSSFDSTMSRALSITRFVASSTRPRFLRSLGLGQKDTRSSSKAVVACS